MKRVKTVLFGDLKPCPECNSIELGYQQAVFGIGYQIGCTNCQFLGPMVGLGDGNAGDAWNEIPRKEIDNE